LASDRIHRIAVPTPFPVGPVNVYLIESARGERPVLVDAGLGSDEAFAVLQASLAARGVAPQDIGSIVLTHHHIDHASGAARLRDASDARVFGHPADGRRLAREGRHPAVDRALIEAGLSAAALAELDSFYEKIIAYHQPLERLEPLADGDLIPSGAGGLRVIYAPGHTQGSLCLSTEDGTLFSGDTVLERITPNAILDVDGESEGRYRALPVYVRSLVKLVRLRPAEVLPGHGRPFPHIEPVVRGAFLRYRERGERILDLLRRRPATVADLGEALFGSPAPDQLFLVISEVYGHLDLLEDHGAVEVVAEHPLRYRASRTLGPDYPAPLN